MRPKEQLSLAAAITSRPCPNSLALKAAERRHDAAIMEALKATFPHVRHADKFLVLLKIEMANPCYEQKGLSLAARAEDIRVHLEVYMKEPSVIPGHYALLHRIYPTYRQMAAEADKDYAKWSVKLGGKTKWDANPDHWRERFETMCNSSGSALGLS